MADTTPQVFVAYEIKPCVTTKDSEAGIGTVESTRSYERFSDAEQAAYEAGAEVFWTLYGREAEGMALAIGDFTSERDAREVAYQITRDKRWLGDTTGLATQIHFAPFALEGEERDIILAALRLWQLTSVIPSEIEEIACNDRDTFMTDDEIDDLCERINV